MPPRKSKVTEVPYDRDGNLCHYPSADARMAENAPFLDTLTLQGKYGRVWYWKGEDGRDWPMFDVHFEALVKMTTLEEGRTPRSVWTVRQMGRNYGIEWVREATA